MIPMTASFAAGLSLRLWLLALCLPLLTACGGAPEAEPEEEHHEEEEATSGKVTLSEDGVRIARIEVEPARKERDLAAVDRASLEVPGQVELDPRRVALVSARIEGRLERLLVVEGDAVTAGQPAAEVFSAEYIAAQSDVQQSARRARSLAGGRDAEGARALAEAASRRLLLLGATNAEVDALAAGGEVQSMLVLRAPFSGRVVKGHRIAGGAIEAGEAIFTVADLSELDVVAEVPEASMSVMRVGRRATITVAAFPDMRFAGEVERLRDQLDPATRTIPAVLHVTNRDLALKPGMYASVRLEVGAIEGGSVLTVPASAVVVDGNAQIVFVEVEARTYERRLVRAEALAAAGSLRASGSRLRVLDGLRTGERVVTRGAFTLKSELAKSAFAEH